MTEMEDHDKEHEMSPKSGAMEMSEEAEFFPMDIYSAPKRIRKHLCAETSFFYKIFQLRHAPRELFLIYLMKFFECLAYYAYAYIFVKYVSDDFGLTDKQAGCLYAGYGLLCSLIGLLAGSYIDVYGVRTSCLIGSGASLLARLLSAFTSSPFIVCVLSLTLFPIGAAFGIPVFALGVRRYSHPDIQAFAFSFFYLVFNSSMLAGGLLINYTRSRFGDGIELPFGILGGKMDWMRVVLMYCALSTCVCVAAAFFLRNIEVDDDTRVEDRILRKARTTEINVTVTPMDQMKVVAKQARFWRLLWITLIFCGVRSSFRHLDATFPKYFTREFGDKAPFELIISINPIVVISFTPVVTWCLMRYKVGLKKTLLVGAWVSSLSLFPLVLVNSQVSAVFFVLILSLGEVIWSPKLYEFSTMVAPKGQEGIYLAITGAPVYLATVIVGLTSGELLTRFCPADKGPEGHYSRTMWFIILLMSIVSPATLWYLQQRLIPKEDERLALGTTSVVKPMPIGQETDNWSEFGIDLSSRGSRSTSDDEITEPFANVFSEPSVETNLE